MKVLIIEDEKTAAINLIDCLKSTDNNINIAGRTCKVADSIAWLKRNPQPDLIFMDIELSDGISFSIFTECSVLCPVVFTTAYTTYLTEAFQYNGIDYLLKPIDSIKLNNTLRKYKNFQQHFINNLSSPSHYLTDRPKTKSRLIVKRGTEFQMVKTDDIVCLFTERKLVFAVDRDNKKYLCEIATLGEVEEMVDPHLFFRINRKYIINANFISRFRSIDRSKINVELQIPTSEELIVSQENASVFKKWISEL